MYESLCSPVSLRCEIKYHIFYIAVFTDGRFTEKCRYKYLFMKYSAQMCSTHFIQSPLYLAVRQKYDVHSCKPTEDVWTHYKAKSMPLTVL